MAFNKNDRVRLTDTVTVATNSNYEILKDRVLVVDFYRNPEEDIIMCNIEGAGPELYGVAEWQLQRA